MRAALIKLLAISLFAISGIVEAQTFSYTKNSLKFDVIVDNPCDVAVSNGSITFKVTGSASGTARVIFISGPTGTAFPDADIAVAGTQTFTFTPAAPQNGTYEFLVRDPVTTADFVNTLTTEFNGVTMTALNPIVLSASTLTNNTDCTNATGQLTVGITGGSTGLLPAGSGNFTYNWTSTSAVTGIPVSKTWDGTTSLNLATLISAAGLPGSNYTLTVTDNLSPCQSTQTFTLTNPAPASFNTTTTSPVVCKGSNGNVSLSGSGGSSVTYEVFLNGTATGIKLTGTGSALSFSIPGSTLSSAGTYNFTIQAKDGFCAPGPMSGTATITVNADVTFSTAVTNASCNGAATGAITVNASGGASPYTFSADNGTTFQASNQFTGLASGFYTIVVKDAIGCTSQATQVTVSQPPPISFTTTLTDPTCKGQSTGSIAISVSGGGTFTYSINNGSTYQAASTFSGLAAGSYTVKVKSSAGCESAGTAVTLTDPAAVTFTSTKTDPLCSTGNTGSITFVAAGGTGPYQFSVNNGTTFSAASTVSSLAAGTYTLVVKDSKGCLSASTSVTLTSPSAVTVAPTVTNETCPGSGNATIVLTGGGGTSPYTFSITGGSTFQAAGTFSNVAAGTYQVQSKDANGCVSATGSATVTAKTPITVTNSKTNISTCSPANDGAVTLSASGGTGPFTYSLDNGVTFGASGTFTGITAGTYTGIAKDNLGCQSSPISLTFALPFTVALSASTTNLDCNGAGTGSIALTATGGNGTYTYSKDNGITFQAGSTFSGLAAGSYTLVAKDGVNCQGTTTATLTEPTAVTITPTGTNILCNGLATGSIAVTASGGNGGFTYSDDNGVTFQASSTFTGLAAATYQVKAKDSKGCTSTVSSVTISQPAALALTTASTNVLTCTPGKDATITATGLGGTGTLTYSIDGTTFQASGNFTGLDAGSFTITLKDANSCTTTKPVTITAPAGPTFTTSQTNLTCNKDGSGIITITATGGTAPLQYSKDNSVTFQSGSTFTSLAAGTYTLVVKDAKNCTFSGSSTLTEPAAIVPSASTTATTCNGDADGTITVTATGGTGAYQYSPDNGVTFQATGSFNGISAAAYSIVVKDASGCTGTTTATVTQPSAITITPTGTNILCNGLATGSIAVTATGGNGGFTYSDDNGVTFQASSSFTGLAAASYQVQAKDNKGCTSAVSSVTISQPSALALTASATNVQTCTPGKDGTITATGSGGTGALTYSINGTTFQATGNFTGVDAGSFTVTLKDANNCTTTKAVTLTSPPTPSFTFTQTNLTCSGDGSGSVVIAASGGTAPIQYSKDNGTTFQAGATFSALAAGTYALFIKDAGNCTSTGTATITQPAAIVPATSITNVSCNGNTDGTITVTATGGTGAYQFSSDNGSSFQATGSFTAIGAATYTVVVKDASGCTGNTTTTVTQPSAITSTPAGTNILCNGLATGSIAVTATGGNGGFTYSDDNGVTFQASSDFTGLVAATYQVQVKDSKGCTSGISSITITEPSALVLSTTGTNVTNCLPGNDGTITASGSGGTGVYEFAADTKPFQASGSFTGLTSGTYNITIRDANQCTTSNPVTLLSPGGLTFTFSDTDLTCFQDGTGAISISASGGTAPLQYSRDNGTTFQSGASFTALAAGDYILLVKDAASCTFTATATLLQPAKVVAGITATDITCNGLTDGKIEITATGGDGTYEYSTDNGTTFQSSGIFSGLSAAPFNIVVRDGNNCLSDATAKPIAEPAAVAYVSAISDATCSNNDGTITITGVAGGVTPYGFSFNGNPIAALPSGGIFNALAAGNYPFIVTDKNGCAKSETFVIVKPADIQASAITTDPTCSGNGSDGVVTVTVTSTGTFEAGISTDANTPPASFQSVVSTGSGIATFSGLSLDDYFITLKGTPLCQVVLTQSITSGPSAVDAEVIGAGKICFEDQATITLKGITGDPTLPYTCEVTDATSAVVLTQSITAAEALADFIINTSLAGSYSVKILQDQTTTSGCAGITSALKPIILEAPASKLDTVSTSRSLSQAVVATGSLDGIILPSGENPYETSLELTTPAVAGQTFFEDFSAAAVPSGGTNPVFSYASLFAGGYTLKLRDAFGCLKTYQITIDLDPELFIPNIFTPNGDLVNDTFYVRNLPDKSALVITNRWGKEIYTNGDYKNDWDAKGIEDGIYYFKLILPDKFVTGWVEVLSGR